MNDETEFYYGSRIIRMKLLLTLILSIIILHKGMLDIQNDQKECRGDKVIQYLGGKRNPTGSFSGLQTTGCWWADNCLSSVGLVNNETYLSFSEGGNEYGRSIR